MLMMGRHYLLVLSLTLWVGVVLCKPVPKRKDVEGDIESQDHQIDNVNEVHHDKHIDDYDRNRQLEVDALPDQNLGAGDGQLQPQPGQDPAVPVEADDAGSQEAENENEMKKMVFEIERINKEGKIPADKLVPADHLDVVKMEHDGHINKEYHKEMFLGGQHDEFNSDTIDSAEVKLKDIVSRADTNKDGYLSVEEMERWILDKMFEHFEDAKRENELIFQHLDPDGDGFIKWKEYYVHFLLSRGFDADNALKHIKDYDDSIELDQEDKDALVSYKFRWTDADKNPTDNKLSKLEFMVFRHPEHSKDTLDMMAVNVLTGIDRNADSIITAEEFAALPPGEVENKEYQEMDRKWQEERRKEFREIMDANHDGKVDIKELKDYLDPTNPIQAKLEAESLMSLMDDSKDNRLSMQEIMKHSDIFISSKLVNFAANVHDEF